MRNARLFLTILLVLWGLTGCAGAPPQPPTWPLLDTSLPRYEAREARLTPEQRFIDELLGKNGYNGNGSKPTVIVVHKSTRKLTLYQGLTPLKTYPVVLGRDPYNDKLCQGDTCTPEGVYRVVAKYPHPRWAMFIWLDYPNNQNWLKFAKAKKEGRLPEDADIGGQVGIHGTEDDWQNLTGKNWTKGCVSLRNQHLEEIYPLVTEKTLVVIKKD